MKLGSFMAALCLCAVEIAHAAPVGVVATDAPGAPVAADELTRVVVAAGRAAGATVDSAPLDRARAQLERGAVPAERLAGFERAQELARQGWRAYLAVEPERARDRLIEARRAARDVLDLDGGLALYADLSLRLGAVLLQLGHDGDAAHALALARALDPGRAVTIDEFAPQVVEAYERAAEAAAKGPRVPVELAVEPAAARIELDGRDLGAGPRTVDLTAGHHVLVARAPGHASAVRVLAITAATQIALDLAPDPEAAAVLAGRAALAPGLSRARADMALRAVLRYAELGSVVVVASAWRTTGPALLGQRCTLSPASPDPGAGAGTEPRPACTAVAEIRYSRARDTAAASRELWAELHRAAARGGPTLLMDTRLLAGTRLAAERTPAADPRSTGHAPRCAWCRNRWLWLGVGASALVLGSTWLWLRDGQRQPVITVDPCQFGGCTP